MTSLTIDAPPTKDFCASCASHVVWLWSAPKSAWIAFVPCLCGTRWSLRPHPCRHLQDPATWRETRTGDPPSAAYLEARKKIASKESET